LRVGGADFVDGRRHVGLLKPGFELADECEAVRALFGGEHDVCFELLTGLVALRS
jgi:hypothetical protein